MVGERVGNAKNVGVAFGVDVVADVVGAVGFGDGHIHGLVGLRRMRGSVGQSQEKYRGGCCWLPLAAPLVRSWWSLKSSGVEFFVENFCLREAVVWITAHVFRLGCLARAVFVALHRSVVRRGTAHCGGKWIRASR